MAYDEGIAALLRDDLADLSGVTEKKMFGGLAFMLNGHMLCGAYSNREAMGGMFRVGKASEAEACEIEGVRPMAFTGRKMGGLVDMGAEAMGEDDLRAQVLALALAFNAEQTPK